MRYDAGRHGQLQDYQMDSTGRWLATASADAVVRLWNGSDGELAQELRGHRSVVSAVAWGQGRFATTLASGATDGQVIVWREGKAGEPWRSVHQMNITGSVNALAFCSPDTGLVLAIAGSDCLGVLTLLIRKESAQHGGEQWQVKSFPAHDGGLLSLSWAPKSSPVMLATGPAVTRAPADAGLRRLATCGADGSVGIWHGESRTDMWSRQHVLTCDEAHGAIRDVAWRPLMGIPSSQLAVSHEDGNISFWAQDVEGQPWELRGRLSAPGDARRLAWSRAGALLAVSVGESEALLYKEDSHGEWQRVASVAD